MRQLRVKKLDIFHKSYNIPGKPMSVGVSTFGLNRQHNACQDVQGIAVLQRWENAVTTSFGNDKK
jgi:hypothetical protein